MRSAPELLPLWDVLDDGVVVTTRGQLLRLFRLTGLDSEHLAGSVLEAAATQLYAGTQEDFPDGLFAQFTGEGHDRYDDVFAAFEEVPPPLDPVLRLQRERRLAFLKTIGLRRFEVILAVGASRGWSKADFERKRSECFDPRRRAGQGHEP